MRLQPNQGSLSAPRFVFQCLGCLGHYDNTEPWWADLDGEAFKAYYCLPCGSALARQHDRTKGADHV